MQFSSKESSKDCSSEVLFWRVFVASQDSAAVLFWIWKAWNSIGCGRIYHSWRSYFFSGFVGAPVTGSLMCMRLWPISCLARKSLSLRRMSAGFIQWWGVVGGISCREAVYFAEHFKLCVQKKSKWQLLLCPRGELLAIPFAACWEKEAVTTAKKSGLVLLLLSHSPLREWKTEFHRY